MNDFDAISSSYDILVRLVFGDKLWQATNYFLKDIDPNASVLILGGGTGRILDAFKGQTITYVEKSNKMLVRARAKTSANVIFIHEDFMEWNTVETYDVVICPFFLDVFDSENLMKATEKISQYLSIRGTLIVTDFQQTGRRKHELLLWIMHAFFYVVTHLESNRLQDIKGALKHTGLIPVNERTWYKGFIFSTRFKKP